MFIKKVVLGTLVGALALVGAPGEAVAETATHHFRIVKIGANPGTVIALGPFYGIGVETNTRHQVPLGSPFQVTFSFDHGDLYLSARPGAPRIDADPVTCVTRIDLQVANEVLGGTGEYEGATGSGSGTSNITQIRGRSADGTSRPLSSPPIFEIAIVEASETITVP